MITMYAMQSCPDCEELMEQVANNPRFQVIDIGTHVKKLKQFIKLRDTNPLFDNAKAEGNLGIPCFVLEDGTVTFNLNDVGLTATPRNEPPSCSIDSKGC